MLCLIHIILGVPFAYCYGTFWHCDYSRTAPVLLIHTSIECWATLNTAMAIVSLLGFVLLLVITGLSALILADINPTSSGICTTFSPVFPAICMVGNVSFAFFQQAIPPYIYYAVPSIYLLKNLGLCVCVWKTFPFFRRIENSVVFGVFLGGCFWAAMSIVSLAANPKKDDTLGLIFMGSAIGSFLLLGLVGFVTVEVKTRFLVRKVQQAIENGENPPCPSLQYFLQWSMRSPKVKDIITGALNMSSTEKQELSFESLITASVYLYYFYQDARSTAIMIFNRASSLLDDQYIFQRLDIHLRRKEIISFNNDDLAQVGEYLNNVLSQQENIMLLQKQFWKTALSQDINKATLIDISSQITKHIGSCVTTLANLNSRKKDRTIIRTYARFLEDFLLEKEYAEELYEVCI